MGQKILVAVDGSEPSERAFDYAARMAHELKDAHLTVLNVGETIPNDFIEHDKLPEGRTEAEQLEKQWQGSDTFHAVHERDRKELFDHLVHRAQQLGLTPDQVDTKYLDEEVNVPSEILNEATRGAYDAICLGKQGRTSMKDYFIGSVSERVVRHARGCTVWVVE